MCLLLIGLVCVFCCLVCSLDFSSLVNLIYKIITKIDI